MNTNFENSVRDKLRNIAQERSIDLSVLWKNLILERFLVRLSKSDFSSNFILKGGMLLAQYIDLHRYTKDLDFLVRGIQNELSILREVIQRVIQIDDIQDGFTFSDVTFVELSHIQMKYSGVRVKMNALFGKSRFSMTIDLGFGDKVSSSQIIIPLIQGSKGALYESNVEVNCYPVEFIFAEKLETVVYRGPDNTRMKDFHDLFLIIQNSKFNEQDAIKVIDLVFDHRQTKKEFPIVFLDNEVSYMQNLWKAHCQAIPDASIVPKELREVIESINRWLSDHLR